MNRIDFNQVGGFPFTTNILNKLQTAFSLFNALGNIVGDLTIISGCEVVGTNVADGVVYINGEVLEFRGGLAQTKVILKEDTESLLFETQNSYPIIKTRYVTFGTGITAINWAEFKRGFQTKLLLEALSNKVDNTAIQIINNKITELEKKNAVFQFGGGMVLWNKPASQIPPGWSEVVNWRGRMPVGFDGTDTDFNLMGKVGGAKNSVLNIAIPATGYSIGANTSGGESGRLIVSTGANEIDEDLESVKKVANTPSINATVSHMNPYRVVMFIEYIG